MKMSGTLKKNRSTAATPKVTSHRRILSMGIGLANDSDQRLATAGLALPLDAIASPLHRLVRRNPGHLLGK
jgi:hypothetical protein